MTNLQLLKLIQVHPRNISLLTKGYITNTEFIFRDGKKAKELLNLYIEREYNDMKKIDTENKLMSYDEWYNNRIKNISDFNIKQPIEFIEGLFDFYDKKRDIEIIEIKKDDKYSYIKLGQNEYYVVDNKYLDLSKDIFKGLSMNILSGEYSEDATNRYPLGIKDYTTGYIVGLIMPLNLELSDYDFEQI